MEYEKRAEWRLTPPPEPAAEALRGVLERLEMKPAVDGARVTGKAPRSFRRNRWSATIEITLTPLGEGSAAVCVVRMSGDRHFTIMDEIAAEAGPGLFADRGVGRLGTLNEKELSNVERLLRVSERVEALGEGRRSGRKLVVVLTDERLFIADKSSRAGAVDDFPLDEVAALRADRQRLVVEAAGARTEIEDLAPGQADELAARFRELRPPSSEAAAAEEEVDPIVLLERLAALRDKGVIEPAEFEAKKAELLRRI